MPVLTIPDFQAAGTTLNGTGAISPVWPTHAVGDIGLLIVESTGGEPVTLSTPAGFVAVTNSPQATGTLLAGTQISVFWCRATSTSMATPTVADPGNHAIGVIVTFRGVYGIGDPWNVTFGDTKGTGSTSDTLPGVTTTVDNCLIVHLATRADAVALGNWSGYTNAALGSLTERLQTTSAAGNGGGILVVTGTKATAGATGGTTATHGNAQITAHLTVALLPRVGGSSSLSAQVDLSSSGGKVGVGAGTLNAQADLSSTGRKSATDAGTLNATVNINAIGSRPPREGAGTLDAQVDLSSTGGKVEGTTPYVESRQLPGIVWRLGKMNGGDDHAGILNHVVEWSFQAVWGPEPVGGYFVYPKAGLPGCDSLFPGAEVAILIGGQERRNCRFTLHNPTEELIKDQDGKTVAHNVRWELLNMFHRLKSGTLRPDDGALVLRPKEFEGDTVGNVAEFLFHEPSTRGAFDELQKGFNEDHDGNDAPWDRLVDLTFERGITSLEGYQALDEMRVADMWFERRKLRIFNRDSMSQNFANEGTKIVLSGFGKDFTGAPLTTESSNRATSVMVKGDEDRFAVAELAPEDFDTVDTHTGYLERTENAAGIKDPDRLQEIAELYLEIYKQPRRQYTYELNIGWGKDPLIHYQLGDWVLKHDGSEVDGKPEKVRVIRCYYRGDQSGVVSAGITVNDWFGVHEERLLRRIDGITGGLPGSAKPNRQDVAPSAPIVDPGDIVMELVPPEHGGIERVKVTVPFTWDGMDADQLAACGDFDTFLGRYTYEGGNWQVIEFANSPAVFPDLDPGRVLHVQLGSQDEFGNRTWTDDLEA